MLEHYGLMSVHTGERLSLRKVDVAARISGILATTTLTQCYENSTDTNLELSYTFPLPVGGILLAFTVRMGERTYVGEVISRQAADVAYEAAIEDGDSAFRLQEIEPGLFNVTLGNVLAGESVAIELTFTELLTRQGTFIRYQLPTTIAPRYGAPRGMQPWQRPETSVVAEYPLSLSVVITGVLADCAMACPSHKIRFKPTADGLMVALGKGASLDRDFILEIEHEEVQSLGVVACHRDTQVAMLTLLPPEVADRSNARDVVFVIDCSGSMQGDSLALAKEGVQLALGSLAPSERFAMVAFGSRFLAFDPALQAANRKNLDMARRWVTCLENLGGTDIPGALDLALKMQDGPAMDILLLTDGQVWDIDSAIALAKSRGVRIFTLGIGSSVAQGPVRMLAEETGGACEWVAPTEDMSARIFRHFNRMRQPQIHQIDVDWSCEPIWSAESAKACFAGDAYTVFAALPDTDVTVARVSFAYADAPTVCQEVVLSRETVSADAIVRAGARQRLAGMASTERQSWAVQHQLVTTETDYLVRVCRADADKATELPALQVQPQMLPAGWGGTSTVVFSRANRSRWLEVSEAGVAYMRSIDYSQISDIPAIVRKRNVTVDALRASVFETDYAEFMAKLLNQADKWLGGLPKTRAALNDLNPPEALVTLLTTLAVDHDEDTLIAAFYQALIEHDGQARLTPRCREKMQAIAGAHAHPADLVSQIRQVLDSLCATKASPLPAERYDIPAFLRKNAD